jgi:glycerate kinase
MNRILIAPDSFKHCLTSKQVAQHIKKGIERIVPEMDTRILPMADGGEGTVQSLVDATEGEIRKIRVHDPLGREIDSFYGLLEDGKTAVIEMAAASGLELLEDSEKDPSVATTYGTGELIKAALEDGVGKIIIGIGGSATNDGGAGMAEALGVKFLDENGKKVKSGGKFLENIRKIDMSGIHPRVSEVEIEVACDVDNPLTGKNGAAHIYAEQKGADEEMISVLDKNLAHFARLIRKELNKDISEIPGSGAAGGLGGGLMAFLSAGLKPGMEIITKVTGLEEAVKQADLVITGEGKTDAQTQYGKTPYGVAKVANNFNKPVVSFAGTLEKDHEVLYEKGFDAILPITEKPVSLHTALDDAGRLLENAAARLMRVIYLKGKI